MWWHTAEYLTNKGLVRESLLTVLISSWAAGFVVPGCGPSGAALGDQAVQNSCCTEHTGRPTPHCAFCCVC